MIGGKLNMKMQTCFNSSHKTSTSNWRKVSQSYLLYYSNTESMYTHIVYSVKIMVPKNSRITKQNYLTSRFTQSHNGSQTLMLLPITNRRYIS